jgi:hypothetical protein
VLFAANWCVSAPNARTPGSDVPLDQKISIRIHTDHKWPERVVFDTTSSAMAQKANAETGVGGGEPPVLERQSFGAFAEMAAISVDRRAPPAKLRSGKPRQLRKARHLKIARG